MNMRRTAIVALAVFAGAVLAASADEGKMGTATIKGVIKLKGDKPKLKAIKMAGDAFCAQQSAVADPATVVFKDMTIPYTFVYIKSGLDGKFTPPTEPAHIDQQGCMYDPHVFGMVAGQDLKITNNDNTAHNIHAKPKKNTEFNFGQPTKGMTATRIGKDTFTKEEVMIQIKCDVHPWMSAFCGVLNHPFFAVSKYDSKGGTGGQFDIGKVPAGEYEIEAWHERFGKLTQKVKVEDGATVEVNFEYDAAKAMAPVPARVMTLASFAQMVENGDDADTAADAPAEDTCCHSTAGVVQPAK